MYPGNGPAGYYPPTSGYQQQYSTAQSPNPSYGQPQQAYSTQTPPNTTGAQSRNLIGSLTVNAFTLNDVNGTLGHWFVLQDLSVRTEGTFR